MSHTQSVIDKILTLEQLEEQVSAWKQAQQKIVFTNGCFDIIHRGHVHYLSETANYGDKLIVAVNSDTSVKEQQKGASRPIQDEYSRAMIIAAMEFVAAVVIFNDKTPLELIKKINPHVLIKGGDYDPKVTDNSDQKYIVGSKTVRENGGAVDVIPFLPGYSTSSIEKKIKQANS